MGKLSALLAGIVLAALLLAALPALGHDQTTSYSTWRVQGSTVDVAVRLTLLDVSRLPWANAGDEQVNRLLAAYLTERLTMRAGNAPCRVVDKPRPFAVARDRIGLGWRLECPTNQDLRLHSEVLLDVAPSHLHFARVEVEGQPPLERVLSDAERDWSLGTTRTSQRQSAGNSIASYLLLGIGHILIGLDHLSFVAALLLLGGTLSEVARLVTGFTVANSITLALAVLGVARPEIAPVEALIGLSIALVAAENLWHSAGRGLAAPGAIAVALVALAAAAALGHGRVPPLSLAGFALLAASYFALLARAERAAPLRSAVAFLFGLLHGFGFAGVLLEAGLPTGRAGPALFTFNLGIELGQLAAVAALWPLLRLVERRGARFHGAVVDYASAAILTVGTFWFVSRGFAR